MERKTADILWLGNREFTVYRLGIREWLAAEKRREAILEAAKVGDSAVVERELYGYLAAASKSAELDLSELAWFDAVELFGSAAALNKIRSDLPMFGSREKIEPLSWDYPEREWYLLAHMLAATYGWTVEYIASQDPDDVYPLVQEILVDEQLGREWQWSLSEIAYPYNSSTKKSEFHALPRPAWMAQKAKAPKTIKWRRDFMPVGNVVSLSGVSDANSQAAPVG